MASPRKTPTSLSPRLGSALLALGSAAACGGGASEGPRTNVVLVVVDTLRADAILDPAGVVDTPSIDALAADGAAFSLAFSHAPMTLPAHTALFSSRVPNETGVLVNGQGVPADLPLLGEHLAGLGYETGAVVSLGTLWHRGQAGTSVDRGFDHYEIAPGYVSPADAVAERLDGVLDDLPTARPFFLFAHFSDPHEPYNAHGAIDRAADVLLDGELLERVTTSDMTSWSRELVLDPGRNVLELRGEAPLNLRALQCHRGGKAFEPAFLEGGMRETTSVVRIALDNEHDSPERVHISFWLTDHPTTEELPRRYMREVEYVDRYVGRLLQALRDRGVYDESLIVFTSDHGEALGERGGGGHVHTLYDELVHVPLIVKPPKGSPALAELRARRGELVSHVDLVPTLLDLLGLPHLPGQQGSSVLADRGEVALFAETHRPEAFHDLLSLRDSDWKLIYVADEDRFQLFDLRADPGELKDVFAEHGGGFVEWQRQLREAAARSREHTLDMSGVDEATLERMRAIGYFGDR
jgi:arylsulfatase A-like enzyme